MRIAIYFAHQHKLNEAKKELEEVCTSIRNDIRIDFYSDERLFLSNYKKEPYHVVFLDYEIAETDRKELFKQIRGENFKTMILVGTENLRREFLKACKIYEAHYQKYIVSCQQTTRMIPYDEIRFVESRMHSVVVHTLSDTLTFYSKLDDEEKKVPEWKFVRIHQSYIVNLVHVACMSGSHVVLDDGNTLKISASRKTEVQEKMKNFAKWMACY